MKVIVVGVDKTGQSLIKNLSNEKIEKMTVARMKKFCEDAANKNGEIIDSNTIKYIEVVTAK